MISKAYNLPAFRSTFATVSHICDFFCKSPKRTKTLEDLVPADETAAAHKKRRLKSLCATRWVERHDSISVLVELFPFVIFVLDDEVDERAVALLCAISRTNFVRARSGEKDPRNHSQQALPCRVPCNTLGTPTME